jgi:hypothetical protein
MIAPGPVSLPAGALPAGAGPLGGLGTVFRATLLAVANTTGIERTTHHVVAHTGQILDAAAANEDDRVLLKVVALTRNVGRNLHLVREPNASDLPKGRVRLLRSHRPDLETHAPRLGRATSTRRPLVQSVVIEPQGRGTHLLAKLLPPLADELADSRQLLLHLPWQPAYRPGHQTVTILTREPIVKIGPHRSAGLHTVCRSPSSPSRTAQRSTIAARVSRLPVDWP